MTEVQMELALYHGKACAFAGRPILGSVADLNPHAGIALGHEWCCCDPYGDTAQRVRDSLRAYERRQVLYQRKLWWPAGATEPIRVKDMSVRYKQNVLAFLERRAHRLKARAELELALADVGGEMAQLAVDQIQHDLARTSTEEWFESLSLIKRLRKDVRKGRGGPID